ncbi:MAG TPA: hypothetical protein VHD76_08040 [Bryobacteraceae bacterium]|nr:hypothetical protein [Bryobacteraceae bacterium]
MNRRTFLKRTAGAALAGSTRAAAADLDLTRCVIVASGSARRREKKAVTVLVEEVEKRSGVTWTVQSGGSPATAIYAGTEATLAALGPRTAAAASALKGLPAESYVIRAGRDANGAWIVVAGADERGLLFGIGKLLQTIAFTRQAASVNPQLLNLATSPKFPLRGHQLGYRPKTNAYDAWNVAEWDQYIRDLALFGTNAIELVPPRTDDGADSPHFPLPPEKMMVEMSRICDDYGLDVWIWYPAMDPDYADAATVQSALKEWAHIFEILPRIDAVLVPGGDPGHTEPRAMLAFLEKQKANLRRFHPKGQMWVSPQGFRESWMQDFFHILESSHTATWLDGVVFGPQSRLGMAEFRQRVPPRYPVRFYPDITHSVECQYPVPEWDVAYAMTEGRECINPRPEGEANIFRKYSADTIGFITYSEGCNDDVNKFVWTALGWDPERRPAAALRDYAHYFFGKPYADTFAQGLLDLENNWRGPLAANEGVPVTLARFQDMERAAPPAILENWRFQMALYRAYYDASVRGRLIHETACLHSARELLERVNEIGWKAQPLDIEDPPSEGPVNGLDPKVLLDEARRILEQPVLHPASGRLRARVRALGEALFQSIKMQLAVDRYRGEAVVRGANLETLDTTITDVAWLRRQIAGIQEIAAPNDQVAAIQKLLARTDPGPGGFYDELGNPANRPHLLPGPGSVEDPEFRASALTGFSYPDLLGSKIPMAWKRWAESLFDAPLRMRYRDLDPEAHYRVRVVYSGDSPRVRLKLVANERAEIHPLITRPWPPKPMEFDVPAEATRDGQLDLTWTREQGLGGNGRGTQVSEVWLFRK